MLSKKRRVSKEDKCRLGLCVPSSIGLEYGKMRRSKESQTGGAKQARQAYQHHTEWRKVYIKHIDTTKVYLTGGYIQRNLRRDRCNHTSTSPRRARSMAKPRSREANMEIKHRSKQT